MTVLYEIFCYVKIAWPQSAAGFYPEFDSIDFTTCNNYLPIIDNCSRSGLLSQVVLNAGLTVDKNPCCSKYVVLTDKMYNL